MRKVFSLFVALFLLSTSVFAQRSLSTNKLADNRKKALEMPSVKQMDLSRHAAVPCMYAASKSASDVVSTFPYTFGFDVDMGTWWTLGGDNEGHNWQLYSPLMDPLYGETGLGSQISHSGNDAVVSMSYYPDSVGIMWGLFQVLYGHAVSADNYLVSPAFTIQANSTVFSFFCKGLSSDHPDSLEVLLSTVTPASGSDFTVNLMPMASIDWVDQYQRLSVDLSAFAGQNVYIAFHHVGTDNYGILIDDVRMGAPEGPRVSMVRPERAKVNTEVPFSFIVTNAVYPTAVEWSFQDADPATDTAFSTSTVWDSVGSHTVTLVASNADGSDTVVETMNVFGCGQVQLPYSINFATATDLGCWEVVDANNDGKTWELYGDLGALNFSYDIDEAVPITPDDYLYLSNIPLPQGQNYELYWEAVSGNDAYPNEYYSVYILDNNFTTLEGVQPVYSGILNRTGDLLSVDLTPYAGDTVTVLFRHHNCTDNMALVISGVALRPLQVPEIEITAPSRVRMGQGARFVVNAGAADVSWTFQNGNPATANTTDVTVVWNTPGIYEISCVATNAVGTDSRIFYIEVFDCGTITELPFVTDFEDATYGCWTNVDSDNDGYSWEPDFLYALEDHQGHNNSLGLCGSASFIFGLGPLTPDNWLISPAIQLPAGTSRLSWYAKGIDPDYYAENYSVYVSTTGSSISDFVTPVCTKTAHSDWHNSQIDLTPYAGRTVYVAFRHHDVSDYYYLALDDIVVDNQPAVGIADAANAAISIYPNPVGQQLNVEGEGILWVQIMDINGRTVHTSDHAGQLDVADLSAGIYFVRVVTPEGIRIEKIIKQ